MKTIIQRILIYWRERRFRLSLLPGAVARSLRIPHFATEHGSLGAQRAKEPAAVEDRIDAWGVTTLADRHKLASADVAHANEKLEKCRFGKAEKQYSNILQRCAARVKMILVDIDGRLREARTRFAVAAQELKRHCLEIAAPRSMAFQERTDALWKAFAFALSVETFAGAVATQGELGWALSLILAGVLGLVVFVLGCGAGWARQHAWLAPRLGWGLFGLSFAVTSAVLLAFCYYRLTLADLAAQAAGLAAPEDMATAAALPPLVLLLAVAGYAAWAWTVHVWLSVYGVAPGVRSRALRRRRAAAECRHIVDEGRSAIIASGTSADGQIDRACAEAGIRRDDSTALGVELLTRGSIYERERESIVVAWGAAHSEFAETVSQMANLRRPPRDLPTDFPIIPTGHVSGMVHEVHEDADALMSDEGRAKLAVAETCAAGLRDLNRLAADLPDLSSGKELLQ